MPARPAFKTYYTAEQANATLPLLRSILRDVTALAAELHERQEVVLRMQDSGTLDEAHREELQQLVDEFEKGRERMAEYLAELARLGIELKDYFTGLVDFPCRMDGRDVYLCWKLGEPAVAHWHELEAGFSGRRPLDQPAACR